MFCKLAFFEYLLLKEARVFWEVVNTFVNGAKFFFGPQIGLHAIT